MATHHRVAANRESRTSGRLGSAHRSFPLWRSRPRGGVRGGLVGTPVLIPFVTLLSISGGLVLGPIHPAHASAPRLSLPAPATAVGTGGAAAPAAGAPAASPIGPGSITATLCLANDTVMPGNATCPDSALGPWGAAYDPVNGEIYLAESGSDRLLVLNATTYSVVTNLTVGSGPFMVDANSASGDIWATSAISDVLTEIAPNNNSVLGNFSTGGQYSYGLAFDPITDDYYVVNAGSYTVSILNASDGTLVAQVYAGYAPHDAVYDPANGDVYVSAQYDGTLTVFPSQWNLSLGRPSIYVDGEPYGMALDPSNGRLYVADRGGARLSVVSTAVQWLLGSVSVGQDPVSVTYDPANGLLYVPDAGQNAVNVVDPSSGEVRASIPTPTFPAQATYDPATEAVLVSDYRAGAISIVSPPRYSVTFLEAGLPAGTSWSASFAGETQGTSGDSITFSPTNGSFTYSVTDVPGWHESTAAYAAGLRVAGAPVTLDLQFARVVYPVTFVEHGLPPGTSWSVLSLYGETVNSLDPVVRFDSANATIAYRIADVGGWHEYGEPYAGMLTVNGSGLEIDLTFVLFQYPITFAESGLPPGSRWWLELSQDGSQTRLVYSTNASITSELPNGSGNYQVGSDRTNRTATPEIGPLVVDGAPYFGTVEFTPAAPPPSSSMFSVSFVENGLPTGTRWWLLVAGNELMPTNVSSTNATISLALPNGSYFYRVGSVLANQSLSPFFGFFRVQGRAYAQAVVPRGVSSPVSVGLFGLPSPQGLLLLLAALGWMALVVELIVRRPKPSRRPARAARTRR